MTHVLSGNSNACISGRKCRSADFGPQRLSDVSAFHERAKNTRVSGSGSV